MIKYNLSPYADEVLGQLVALSDLIVKKDPRNSIGQPATRLDGFRFLGSSLDRLLAAVDAADAAPSPDVASAFKQTDGQVKAAFSSKVTPESPELRQAIEAALKE